MSRVLHTHFLIVCPIAPRHQYSVVSVQGGVRVWGCFMGGVPAPGTFNTRNRFLTPHICLNYMKLNPRPVLPNLLLNLIKIEDPSLVSDTQAAQLSESVRFVCVQLSSLDVTSAFFLEAVSAFPAESLYTGVWIRAFFI